MAEEVKVVDREYLKRQFQNYNTKIVLPMFEQLDDKKVDKVEGYGLSKNDFTDELKAKLESLENYDDTVIEEKIAKIVADAPEDFDTLKELSDWISGHAESAATMNSQIADNKSATETNAAAIAVLNGDAETEGSVANAVANAMSNIALEDIDIDFDDLYGTPTDPTPTEPGTDEPGNGDEDPGETPDTDDEETTTPDVEISGEAEVKVGETITLSTNAEDVTWTSEDDDIATVVGGVVTGVSEGVVTITASAEGYNPGTKSITVNVKAGDEA